MEKTDFETINLLIARVYGDKRRSYEEGTDIFN